MSSGDLSFRRRWSDDEEVFPGEFKWNGRPLVVLDPEDREQVERLRDLFDVEVIRQNDDPDPRDVTPGARRNALQAALREFASPTQPKPDEPMGLGAVVEDERGKVFIRHLPQDAEDDGVWFDRDGDYFRWSKIAAVRVLSEGVSDA